MPRMQALSEGEWARLESLLPSSEGQRGRPFRDDRQVVEGTVFRYRTGRAWRDLPTEFGPWQTVWKRHARFSRDGTWDRVSVALGVIGIVLVVAQALRGVPVGSGTQDFGLYAYAPLSANAPEATTGSRPGLVLGVVALAIQTVAAATQLRDAS